MDIQARRFMSFIKRGMNQTPDLYNKMDIVLPTNAVPFQERFNDFVGGVALDCNFVVFTDINACDYYEPEPSPTPSNTPGPTNTPTITPTSTLTPTPTPNRCITYSGTSYGSCCYPISYTDCIGTLINFYYEYYSGGTFCARINTIQNPFSGTPGINEFITLGNC
jgi:hypothetical protein